MLIQCFEYEISVNQILQEFKHVVNIILSPATDLLARSGRTRTALKLVNANLNIRFETAPIIFILCNFISFINMDTSSPPFLLQHLQSTSTCHVLGLSRQRETVYPSQ